MISVERLWVKAGAFSIRDVTFHVGSGRRLVILGPTGAGKSILLETLMGVRRPEAGRVLIDGRDILPLPPEKRCISYVPQDLALFPHLGVRQNILFGLRLRRGVSVGPLLRELVEAFHLEGVLERSEIGSLSGGERQRVALARALIVSPRVLFLDEPFSALDRVSRLETVATLGALTKKLGTTVVHVTHDIEEASAFADDLAILIEGRLVQHGTREEVLFRPKSRAVARLLLVKNILPQNALRLIFPEGTPSCPWVAIRPEEVVLLKESRGLPNCFEAEVREVTFLASRWWIHVGIGNWTLEASVSLSQFRLFPLQKGERFFAHLPPEALIPLED